MKRKTSLTISHTDNGTPAVVGLRHILSSLRIQHLASPATEWALHSTKSVSSAIGSSESVRRWWDWGWSWILLRKPVFAQDLELNEEETKALASHSQGSWRHIFYKFRSEIRRLIRPDRAVLPQTCWYDSFSHRNNNFKQPRADAGH